MPKGKPGRIPEIVKLKRADTILDNAAAPAAHYLGEIVAGRVRKPSWSRIRCAIFIIEQVLGKAPQKHELTGPGGEPLDLKALAILFANDGTEKYLAGGTNTPPRAPQLAQVVDGEVVNES